MPRLWSIFSAFLACIVLVPAPAQAQFTDYFEHVFQEVELVQPVALRPLSGSDDYLLIVEQHGLLSAVSRNAHTAEKHIVLDLTEQTFIPSFLTESGLLGVAAHPNHADNGYLFVFYIADVDGAPKTRISRFEASGEPPLGDVESEVVFLELDREDWAHNGGDLHFGPDGYLYASIGDGACCADPLENGQDLGNLFSTVIRIDVDNPSETAPYSIPPDNPFVDNLEARGEIFAYGFRNPWRFSVDHPTGEIWLGDVGELSYEEINLVVPGGNYGWSIAEGPDCFEWPPGSGNNQDCDLTGLIPPVVAFGRDDAVSMTGGYVYRGTNRPSLQGRYVFADWGSTAIWAMEYENGEMTGLTVLSQDGWPLISSFGIDQDNELYAVDHFGGRIWRFKVEEGSSVDPVPDPAVAALRLVGPNPTRGAVNVEVESRTGGNARLVVYDLAGRRIAVPEEVAALPGEAMSLSFDAPAANGIYFLSLYVDGVHRGTVRFTVIR